MAETIKLELVSPERLLLSEQVEMVIVPGAEGVFGVLPLHAPTLSTLKPGFVEVHKGDAAAESFFVTGGFAEVTPASVTVLVDEAIPRGTLTREYAAQRLADAKARLDAAANDDDRRIAAAAVTNAEAMVQAAA
jgi:F-type H+-transporting ATPase subunit epsilon